MVPKHSTLVEKRIIAFALGHPVWVRLASPPSSAASAGRLFVSHNGVWRCLRRHGLNIRHTRLSLAPGYAAPCSRPREPEPERHVEAKHPGELGGWTSSTWGGWRARSAPSGN